MDFYDWTYWNEVEDAISGNRKQAREVLYVGRYGYDFILTLQSILKPLKGKFSILEDVSKQLVFIRTFFNS
jgi:hypothetical protein